MNFYCNKDKTATGQGNGIIGPFTTSGLIPLESLQNIFLKKDIMVKKNTDNVNKSMIFKFNVNREWVWNTETGEEPEVAPGMVFLRYVGDSATADLMSFDIDT